VAGEEAGAGDGAKVDLMRSTSILTDEQLFHMTEIGRVLNTFDPDGRGDEYILSL
jgi:hypothetical protein